MHCAIAQGRDHSSALPHAISLLLALDHPNVLKCVPVRAGSRALYRGDTRKKEDTLHIYGEGWGLKLPPHYSNVLKCVAGRRSK